MWVYCLKKKKSGLVEQRVTSPPPCSPPITAAEEVVTAMHATWLTLANTRGQPTLPS